MDLAFRNQIKNVDLAPNVNGMDIVCLFFSFDCVVVICLAFCCCLSAYFLNRERKNIELDGWGNMENLGHVGRELQS